MNTQGIAQSYNNNSSSYESNMSARKYRKTITTRNNLRNFEKIEISIEENL